MYFADNKKFIFMVLLINPNYLNLFRIYINLDLYDNISLSLIIVAIYQYKVISLSFNKYCLYIKYAL